ncbi:MAG: hypothetical protein RJB13_800 [Pseudomonadota bacterium]|jgi:hypothetical protein
MRKYLFLGTVVGVLGQYEVRANWDLTSVQTNDDKCAFSDVQVDESKLSMTLKDFSAGALDSLSAIDDSLVECKTRVSFLLPAGQRLGTFTHRVIAYAAKDELAELRMNVSINHNLSDFTFRGTLPFGTRFNDRVLLYKSFDVRKLVECSDIEQLLVFNISWTLEVIKRAGAKIGYISMAEDGALADTWLKTEACSLSNALTR